MNGSAWIFVLFSCLFIQIRPITALHCYDDLQNKTVQLIETCRACVIYIDARASASGIVPKKGLNEGDLFIEDFVLSDEQKRRQRRWSPDIIIHQKCARDLDGPIYGFDQTHCYCNSNLCNTNIQRCIYEIASKRYFSCYHGANSTGLAASLEISKKCRSCRIRKLSNSSFQYECLTFGEQEQQTETHCACQHSMCNQDLSACQRSQQISSQARVNSFLNSTESPLTPMTMNSTKSLNSTVLITNQTIIENLTSINDTSLVSNETILIEAKNQANPFFTKPLFLFYVMISLNI